MSQWTEVRHLHLVEGVAKKQIARRLQLDIKTVRRALAQPRPLVRVSSPRVRSLDPWREQIAQWLAQDRRRQLPAQGRHTQPGVPRDTGGATTIALVATWPPVASLCPASSRRYSRLQGGPFSRGQKVPFLLAIPNGPPR